MTELVATYRLQLRPGFDFDAAAAVVPYLAALGVSHLYLSPITEARPGSEHGYDVVDHARVREELGGEAGFERLREACVAAGLGIVLDFVPNHAGVGASNEAWQDVLAHGEASPFADTFDIDSFAEPLLLPFLGAHYGEALDGGELSLRYEGGHLAAAYYDHRFRLRPESYGRVLEGQLAALSEGGEGGSWARLAEDFARAGDRERFEVLREQMAQLDPAPLRAGLAAMPPDALHEILEAQRWRLAHWRTAGAEVNYRRFFDINELAGLRVENARVFDRMHACLDELLSREGVDGVRVDHIDGLYDPHLYLRRLRELGAAHVWVEKILGARETLPDGWPIDGTTGYEALNDILRVLVYPGGEGPLTRLWQRASSESWEETVHGAKRLVMRTALGGELRRLVDDLFEMSRADYRTRDFTRPALAHALEEVIAALDRYRTYLPDEPEQAREVVEAAVERAVANNPADERTTFDHVGRAILGPLDDALEGRRRLWVRRLQQYCAPVAAKGVEDTAFYRYLRLPALNEVGGEPDVFTRGPRAFHSRMKHRARVQPNGLTCTATHDHKRGEDLRLRIALLSELHRPWTKLARRLERLGRRHRTPVGPSAADASLVHVTYAALYGAPDLEARLLGYVEKAAREAKRRTSWTRPDATYEGALAGYVTGMLRDEAVHEALAPFAARLCEYGFLSSITQTVLKHCVPGVPDLYQGTERLDLSLVDPDNRRPVDFEARRRTLAEMQGLLEAPDPQVLGRWLEARDVRLKLFVTARLLRARRRAPAAWRGGRHQGVKAPSGALAFQRGEDLCVAVPRFPSRPVDATVALSGEWDDVLWGGRVSGALRLEGLRAWRVLRRVPAAART